MEERKTGKRNGVGPQHGGLTDPTSSGEFPAGKTINIGEDHVVLEFDPPVVVAEAPGYREVVRHAIVRLSALRRLFPSKGEPGKQKP